MPLSLAVLYLETSVDHPCYQCGTAVEDGVPFCPQCSAPQIRVASEPALAPAVPEPFSLPLSPYLSTSRATVPPTAIEWRQALSSAVLAGFLASALMIIPLGASFGLGMLAAGFFCVLFYRRRVPTANPTPWMGARLGALSGALGFVLFGLLTLIETAVFRAGNEFRSALVQAVEQAAAKNSDPQAQQMLQFLKTPKGLLVVMVMGLTAMFFVFLIFSSLGGAVGAAVLRRRSRS